MKSAQVLNDFLDPNDVNERAAEKKEMLIEINSAKEKRQELVQKMQFHDEGQKAAMTIQPALKKFWVGANDDAGKF